jgi:DNA-directed RNA polymerase subunit E'/Rpb7
MTSSTKAMTSTQKKKGIYMPAIITRNIPVNIVNVGRNIMSVLKNIVSNDLEGKCCDEGYVKPDTVEILTYSSGMIRSNCIHYEVVFECEICNPVEGMVMNCIAKNVTKAGIRAEMDGVISPLVIFVARDHSEIDEYFNSIKVNDKILIKVIGKRYELNDKYISVIAELMPPIISSMKQASPQPKVKLVIE